MRRGRRRATGARPCSGAPAARAPGETPQPPGRDPVDLDRRARALCALLPDPRAIDALWPPDPVCAYATVLGRLDVVEARHCGGVVHHPGYRPACSSVARHARSHEDSLRCPTGWERVDVDPHTAERAFELLGRQVEAYAEASEVVHLVPVVDGSRAHREIGEHPEWPVREAWSMPHLPLIVAEDHLRLIAAGARTPKLCLGVLTSGRVALETAARAYWLIGDPGQDLELRRRVARYYSYRLSDLVRTRDLAETLTRAVGPDAVAEAQQRLDGLLGEVARAGLALPKPRKRLTDPVEVDGEKVPKPTRLAGIALSEGEAQWGERLYDRASAILHGRASGVFSVTSTELPTFGSGEPGVSVRALHKSTTDVALAVAAPLITHAYAVQRLAEGTGIVLEPRWLGIRDLLAERVKGHLAAAAVRVRAGTAQAPNASA